MKRIIGFFIAFFLSTFLYTVVAQEEDKNEQNALRNYVERNTYGDNWFISLGGNGNLLIAEQDVAVSLSKRIKYGGALAFGKWFTPDFGARIQVMGGSLRGFNYIYNRAYMGASAWYVWNNYDHRAVPQGVGAAHAGDDHVDPNNPDYANNFTFVNGRDGIGFWQDFNYAQATIDLMANFTNLFRGHYRDRSPIDFVGILGLGIMHAFDNHVTTPNFTHFVAKVGFKVSFNITNNFSIYLEPQGNMTPKEFDGYSGDNFADGVLNVGLGIQYTFNKRFASASQMALLTADEIDRLNKKINDQRYLIENHQDILERQQNLLERLGKCCDENAKSTREVVTQVVETGGGGLPEYIRFALDSYKIEPVEQHKIVEVADYLKSNPNSKLLIIGYADRKTGNPPYNFNLSQKRVEGVAAELKRLGINGNRLIVEWKGDKEQPFPQNEWNRVVVMVERK